MFSQGESQLEGSRFEQNLDNTVNHFKLLQVALGEERINALPDIVQRRTHQGCDRQLPDHVRHRRNDLPAGAAAVSFAGSKSGAGAPAAN